MPDERIGGAFFELNADIGKFRSNLLSAEGLAHTASTAIGTAMGSLLSTLQSQLAKIASIPGQALAEYKANLSSMAQVEARIRSTGGAAGLTGKDIQKMAEDLQGVTGYSHEATQQMQSMLLTFTNIKGDNFKQVTEAVLDMSAAFGEGDLTSSAIRVGKALQDPIEGATALRRVGVMLTESQMAVIKSMTEMGNIAGAQGIILKELNTEFGGSARAAREAGDGSITLKNTWGELMETMGKSVFGVVKPVNKELAEMVGNTTKLINLSKQMPKMTYAELGVEMKKDTTTPGQFLSMSAMRTQMKEEARLMKEIMGGGQFEPSEFDKLSKQSRTRLEETFGRNNAGNLTTDIKKTVNGKQVLDGWIKAVVSAGVVTRDDLSKMNADVNRIFAQDDATAEAAIWKKVDMEAAAQHQMTDAEIKAAADEKQMLDDLLLKMLDINAEIKAETLKARKELLNESFAADSENGYRLTGGKKAGLGKSFDEMKKAAEEWARDNPLKAEIQSVADIANTAGVSAMNSFADAITNAVWASEGFGKIAENFGIAIGQMATELLAKMAIFKLLSLIPGMGSFANILGASWGMLTNAHGNAFSDGNVMAFAHGGVVNSPTVFPMARGMGLMGEGGRSEAVVPLDRNKRTGDLGITMSGMAPIHTHVYLNGREIAMAVSDVNRLDRRRGL